MHKKRLMLAMALALFVSGACGSMASARGADRDISVAPPATGNLQTYQTEHFTLMTSADSTSAASVGVFLEQVRQRFYSSFEGAGFSPQPSSGKLACVCVDSYAQLDSYARVADGVDASWMGGYYSQQTNRMAIVRSSSGVRAQPKRTSPAVNAVPANSYSGSSGSGLNLRTVTHELAHQLAFNSGLQRKGVNYPFWVTEGLATNFEADGSGAYGMSRNDAGYRSRLIQLKANGRLIPLAEFVKTTESSGQDQAAHDRYAQAWGLFHYLFQYRRQELKQYMTGSWAPFQSPERRFTDIFGPIEPLEKDFQRSLGE